MNRNMIGWWVVVCLAFVACGDDESEPKDSRDASAGERDSGNEDTPTETIKLSMLKLPVTADSYPFGAADHNRAPMDLSAGGYMEEEFIVSGSARTYDWPEKGGVQVRTEPAPYSTRVLVRRPKTREKFSGRVIVEMLNPTNRFDLEIGWALSHDHFMREGDAWVGITSKPIAIAALKAFNPKRYETLSWANPLPTSDEKNCEMVAADSSRDTENGLIWDIFSQVSRLLRTTDKTLLGGYPVKRLYAFGYSQTGGYLGTYINAIEPREVALWGKSAFDAFLIGTYSGVTPINQCAAAIPRGDDRLVRRDVGVPIMRILTQSDYVLFASSTPRPNSAKLPDAYWLYEVAGAAHATPAELDYAPSVDDLMKAGVPLPATECEVAGKKYPRSPFPLGLVFNAAWHNLERWAEDGVAPPEAARIMNVSETDTTTAVDEQGNAKGGLRTPVVDAPISTWHGNAAGNIMESLICYLAGYEEPLANDKRKALYPTHDDYVRKVQESADAAVAGRFLLEPDAKKLVEDAKNASVP